MAKNFDVAAAHDRKIVEAHGEEGATYLLAQAGITLADNMTAEELSTLDYLAAERMIAAAKKAGKPVPSLLEAVRSLQQARADRMKPA